MSCKLHTYLNMDIINPLMQNQLVSFVVDYYVHARTSRQTWRTENITSISTLLGILNDMLLLLM